MRAKYTWAVLIHLISVGLNEKQWFASGCPHGLQHGCISHGQDCADEEEDFPQVHWTEPLPDGHSGACQPDTIRERG